MALFICRKALYKGGRYHHPHNKERKTKSQISEMIFPGLVYSASNRCRTRAQVSYFLMWCSIYLASVGQTFWQVCHKICHTGSPSVTLIPAPRGAPALFHVARGFESMPLFQDLPLLNTQGSCTIHSSYP